MKQINNEFIFPENIIVFNNVNNRGTKVTYLDQKGYIDNVSVYTHCYLPNSHIAKEPIVIKSYTSNKELLPKTIPNVPIMGIKMNIQKFCWVDPRGFTIKLDDPFEFLNLISQGSYSAEMGFLSGVVYVWENNSSCPMLVSEDSKLYQDLLDMRRVRNLASLKTKDLKIGMIYVFDTGEKRTFLGKGPLHDLHGVSMNENVCWFLEHSDGEIQVDHFSTGIKLELKPDSIDLSSVKSQIKDLRYIGTNRNLVRAKTYTHDSIYYWLDPSDGKYKKIYILKYQSANNNYIFRVVLQKHQKHKNSYLLKSDFSNYEIYKLV